MNGEASMTNNIPASTQSLTEAQNLAEEILRNVELGEITLSAIALKASRLARLMNDFENQKIFELEAGGYPSTPDGVEAQIWKLGELAGRTYKEKEKITEGKIEKEEIVERMYLESIDALEQSIKLGEVALDAARDASVSISSANPHQYVGGPAGNSQERIIIRNQIAKSTRHLSSRRAFIYAFANAKYYELKFSGIAQDIFSRLRSRIDSLLGEIVPESTKRFAAIYDNLASENEEDWSNAVHSCRRILQDLADALFPPRSDRTIEVSGKPRVIHLGSENYINRLIAYIEEKANSERFEAIVGSHLRFVGERLDATFQAAQKGSHTTITTQQEADRYVVYTYMIVGDLLSLAKPDQAAHREIVPPTSDAPVGGNAEMPKKVDKKPKAQN